MTAEVGMEGRGLCVRDSSITLQNVDEARTNLREGWEWIEGAY